MNNNNILILGAGGHARSILDVLKIIQKYDRISLVGLRTELSKKVDGVKVEFVDQDLHHLTNIFNNIAVGIGQCPHPNNRIRLFNLATSLGFNTPIVCSPTAYISNSSIIGKGTFISHNATINAGVSIGSNCVINTGAVLEHDCCIGDNTHICPSVTLNGNVNIGEGSFIGSNSVIYHGVTLKQNSIIPAGSIIKFSN